MKKVVYLFIYLYCFSSFADCLGIYQDKLMRQEIRRDRILAASVATAAVATAPIFTPVGAAILGGLALGAGGTTYTAQMLNKNGRTMPAGLKEYAIIHEVLYPGTGFHLKQKSNTWLMGRRTQINYLVSSVDKTELLEKLTDSLQADAFCNISIDDVRYVIKDLILNNDLCKNKKGKDKALLFSVFKNKISSKLCL